MRKVQSPARLGSKFRPGGSCGSRPRRSCHDSVFKVRAGHRPADVKPSTSVEPCQPDAPLAPGDRDHHLRGPGLHPSGRADAGQAPQDEPHCPPGPLRAAGCPGRGLGSPASSAPLPAAPCAGPSPPATSAGRRGTPRSPAPRRGPGAPAPPHEVVGRHRPCPFLEDHEGLHPFPHLGIRYPYHASRDSRIPTRRASRRPYTWVSPARVFKSVIFTPPVEPSTPPLPQPGPPGSRRSGPRRSGSTRGGRGTQASVATSPPR